jgi:hypothetical protein
MYAIEQFELGAHYSDLLTGDRAANLARAIDCYSQALRFFTAEETPRNYAKIQVNLGLVARH